MLCLLQPFYSLVDSNTKPEPVNDSEHYTFYYGDSLRRDFLASYNAKEPPTAASYLKRRLLRLRDSRPDKRQGACVEVLLASNIGLAYEHVSGPSPTPASGPLTHVFWGPSPAPTLATLAHPGRALGSVPASPKGIGLMEDDPHASKTTEPMSQKAEPMIGQKAEELMVGPTVKSTLPSQGFPLAGQADFLGAMAAAGQGSLMGVPGQGSSLLHLDNMFGELVKEAVMKLPPAAPRPALDYVFAQHEAMVILFQGRLTNPSQVSQMYREAIAHASWLGAQADPPPSPRGLNDAQLLLALAYDHMATLRAEREGEGPEGEEEEVKVAEEQGLTRAGAYRTKQLLGALKGAFAFIIIDMDGKEIFVARDGAGLADLYWSALPDGSLHVSSDERLLDHDSGGMLEEFPAGSYFAGRWSDDGGWLWQDTSSFLLATGSVPRINSRGQICKVASGGDLPALFVGASPTAR